MTGSGLSRSWLTGSTAAVLPLVQHLRVRHRDGHFLWVETTSVRITYRRAPALQISYMDVTDRMATESLLTKSETKLRSLIEQNTIGVVLLDEGKTIVEWNRVMEKITGMPRSVVMGKSPDVLADLFPPDGSALGRGMMLVEEPASASAVEGEIRSKNGVLKTVRASIFPISLPEQDQFACMVEDVTAQHRSEEAYRVLVENSLEGFAIIQEGRIVFCNPALLRLNGYTLAETYALGPESVAATIHPEDRALVMNEMQAILGGGIVRTPRLIRMFRRDGELRWVEVTGAATEYDFRPALQVSYLDVTDRYLADLALGKSEGRFRTLIEKAPVAIGISRGGEMIYGNRACQRMFGLDRASSIVGRSFADMIAPDCRDEVLARALRRGRGEPAETEFELRGLRADGTVFPCIAAVTLLDLDDGPAAVAFFSDLTELKESQTKLRNLAVHLLSAREEERKQVAREIHDELGQLSTAIKMDLRWIEKRLAQSPEAVRDKIHGTVGLADQTIEIVHRISSDLRPGPLDDLGLASAVEWATSDFTRRTGIRAEAQVEISESRIGGNAATALFRIIQESLTNVARHARAQHVSVVLQESGELLQAAIDDDGVGITSDQANSFASFGLIGVRERVRGMGGEVTITGKPGEGTCVRLSIPFPAQGGLA